MSSKQYVVAFSVSALLMGWCGNQQPQLGWELYFRGLAILSAVFVLLALRRLAKENHD